MKTVKAINMWKLQLNKTKEKMKVNPLCIMMMGMDIDKAMAMIRQTVSKVQ